MTLDEIEKVLGKPTEIGWLALPIGPKIDGRIHIDLSNLVYSDRHYAQWLCMLSPDDGILPGMREAIGRYCLAVENDGGDWQMSATCELHAACVIR